MTPSRCFATRAPRGFKRRVRARQQARLSRDTERCRRLMVRHPLFLTLWATGMRSTKADSPPTMAIQNVAAMSLLTFCPPEIGFRPAAARFDLGRTSVWVLIGY